MTLTASRESGLLKVINRLFDGLERLLSYDLIALITRLSVASVFFMSGRSKVDGFLNISDGTYTLFREDYRLPFISPEIAAPMATYAEHMFSILLVVGLFTRFSAIAFLAMTAVIEIFVYPDAWPTHLSWAALLILLIGRGGGRWSLDQALKIR